MKAADHSIARAGRGRGHAQALIELLERLCQDEEICIGLRDGDGQVFELGWRRDRSVGMARWVFGPVGHTTSYTAEQLPMALHLSSMDDAVLLRALRETVIEQMAVAELVLADARGVLREGTASGAAQDDRTAGLNPKNWLLPGLHTRPATSN